MIDRDGAIVPTTQDDSMPYLDERDGLELLREQREISDHFRDRLGKMRAERDKLRERVAGLRDNVELRDKALANLRELVEAYRHYNEAVDCQQDTLAHRTGQQAWWDAMEENRVEVEAARARVEELEARE